MKDQMVQAPCFCKSCCRNENERTRPYLEHL